jgi:hypothetical protein
MRRDDIIKIICTLKYSCDDFETMQTSFSYQLSGRKYEIKFGKEEGRVVSFEVKDVGEISNENN